MRYRFLVVLVIVLSLLVSIGGLWDLTLASTQAQASGTGQTEPPPPDMPPLPQGLDPPPTVYPPTQVSLGSYTYYMVCMACHGDRGQGLTDEWRGALDPPDQNCWQSKCHASNHPPEGFKLPEYIPAVTGGVMLARFGTALDLYQYLKTRMPWQAPGILSDQEYWQLTAFLLKLNGIDPGSQPLDENLAAQIRMRPLPLTTPTSVQVLEPRAPGWMGSGPVLVIGGVVLALILLIVVLSGLKGKDFG